MKRQRSLFKILPLVVVAAVVAILASPALASADWQKILSPPDADKPGDTSRNVTCWQATAANMLAGAGYGDGTTVQQRAQDIYDELFANYGNKRGWTDTAIKWWLRSAHNTEAGSNPYTVVQVQGNKSPKYAWNNTNGARLIGNELRACQMVGLSISWPTSGTSIGDDGHAMTAWGDSGDASSLTTNPARLIVADSDRDTGGDVQTYDYDAYNNPNPGGPDEGNGWYIDYDTNHPYIKHIVTLCPTDNPSDQVMTQKVVGSYSIHQGYEMPATDLHYRVGTDVPILSYRTTIDWETDNPPTIVEDSPRYGLTVDWDLSDNPVPYCTSVTITTEFVLPYWNSLWYEDVHFTYPDDPNFPFPPFRWELFTPELDETDVVDICGGYVVGSFDLLAEGMDEPVIGQYRFLHQYDYFQDPEEHYFSLMATEEQVVEPYNIYAANLRFGHSYGFLDTDSLWEFEDWITSDPESYPLHPYEPIEVGLYWDGFLPYPSGDGPLPTTETGGNEQEQCGTTPAGALPLALVSVAIVAVWRTKRRGRGPDYT